MARIHKLFAKHNSIRAMIKGRFLRHANLIGQNLIKAGYFIQRESMRLVPVWRGNLRDSAFTRFTGSGMQTRVEVGYTASYALFVHEFIDYAHGKDFNKKYAVQIAKHNYTQSIEIQGPLKKRQKRKTQKTKITHKYWFNRGERQQAKFLSNVVLGEQDAIAAIIRRGLT